MQILHSVYSNNVLLSFVLYIIKELCHTFTLYSVTLYSVKVFHALQCESESAGSRVEIHFSICTLHFSICIFAFAFTAFFNLQPIIFAFALFHLHFGCCRCCRCRFSICSVGSCLEQGKKIAGIAASVQEKEKRPTEVSRLPNLKPIHI